MQFDRRRIWFIPSCRPRHGTVVCFVKRGPHDCFCSERQSRESPTSSCDAALHIRVSCTNPGSFSPLVIGKELETFRVRKACFHSLHQAPANALVPVLGCYDEHLNMANTFDAPGSHGTDNRTRGNGIKKYVIVELRFQFVDGLRQTRGFVIAVKGNL